MPPSTITTSGTQSPLVASALSYPANEDPTTYLPYASPQILTSSGTWRHPKPGFAISISYIVLGGGGGGVEPTSYSAMPGGGGSGRISTYTTATVTKNLEFTIGAGGATGSNATGSAGGTTTFNGLSAAGGAGGLMISDNSTGGAGGSGGFGGGGGSVYGNATGGAGGAGLDFIGGGGGAAGTPGNGGRMGASVVGGMSTLGSISYLTTFGGGWPNGGQIPNLTQSPAEGSGGMGGWPGMFFSWMHKYGAGGNSKDFHLGTSATAGIQGAIFIWYNRT